MTEEIKPCPFCGASAKKGEVYRANRTTFYSFCCSSNPGDKCMASPAEPLTGLRWFNTRKEAIAAWNKRASNHGEIVKYLQTYRKAYDESLCPPRKPEEFDPMIRTVVAFHMGRFLLDNMIRDWSGVDCRGCGRPGVEDTECGNCGVRI